MDLRDPGFSLLQRFDARMHGMRTQYQVIIMWDSRTQYEFHVRFGFEFQRGARRPEGHDLTLLYLVRNENRALADSGPQDGVPGWRPIAPPFSGFQMHGEVVHRRRGFDRTCRSAVAADQHARGSVVGHSFRRQIDAL